VKLSILIPSLYTRVAFLTRLLNILAIQNADCLNKTEILINTDNRIKKVGAKRNELLQAAKGEYVVFIDDDDTISEDYLLQVFKGINIGVDHVGISMMYQPDKGKHMLVRCSKDYTPCEKDGVYLRMAQHVCPIKATIAKQIPFTEINFGEDTIYAEKVSKLIKTEHLIDKPIYFYLDRINKTT
jgi:glycosyltransferase involved in cell wall biosynthesis